MNEQIEQLIEATIEEHIDEMLGDGGFTKESLELTIKRELSNISVAERDIGKQVENVEKVLYLKALSGELGAIKLFLERHAKESEVVGEYKVVKYVIGKSGDGAIATSPKLASSQPKENVNILTVNTEANKAVNNEAKKTVKNDADTGKSV